VPTISFGAMWFVETISEMKFAVIPIMPVKQTICRHRTIRKVLARGAAPYEGTGIVAEAECLGMLGDAFARIDDLTSRRKSDWMNAKRIR